MLAKWTIFWTKKIYKILAFLRQQGYIVSTYIVDIIIIDESFDACISATVATIKLLDYLGFLSILLSLYFFLHSVSPILVLS